MTKAGKPFLGLQGQSLSWAITLCAGSAFLLFGYDQGVLGSIISGSDFLGALGIAPDDPDTLSTVVSIYDIGVSPRKSTRMILFRKRLRTFSLLTEPEHGRMSCCCNLGRQIWPPGCHHLWLHCHNYRGSTSGVKLFRRTDDCGAHNHRSWQRSQHSDYSDLGGRNCKERTSWKAHRYSTDHCHLGHRRK